MTRLAAIAALAALSLLVSGHAEAVHDPACGGGWTTRGSCPFEMQGIPVTVSAEASGSGTMRVHAWISIVTPVGEQVLAECDSSGAGYAQCDAEVGIGYTLDPYLRSLPLVCNVQGRGPGTYGCWTYPYL